MSSKLIRSVCSQPKKYTLLIELKFLFLMIKIILVICVYLTYDENIFSGLSLVEERDSDKYHTARSSLLAAISFFSILATGELFITISGYTYNFNKNNILIVSLNIFAIYLLGYFIFDAWHYVTIWYIFIVAEFPQAAMEGYGFFSAVSQQLFRYNKMRELTLDKSK